MNLLCKRLFGGLLLMILTVPVFGAKKYKLVEIETNVGTIKIRLYEDTPVHSENFLKLVEHHHYDSLLFHRVIKDFMIQGGSSDSRNAPAGKLLGTSDPGYTIEAEIRPGHYHIKGALAAARQGDQVNPEKKSSPEQFYIVHGKTYSDEELDQIEKNKVYMARNELGAKLYKPVQQEHQRYLRNGQQMKADSLIQVINAEIERKVPDSTFSFSPEVRELYKSVGGAPFLDGNYTVFGEVVEGMEVLDKIAVVKTDRNDRPQEDILILGIKLKRK